ncbi:hypothetical protein EE612_036594 [Oryza sativa]|nr:hypothetical protein EE612_036594 [Oryza sativa]
METLLVVVVGPEAPRNSLDSPLYDHTTITMTSTMRQKPPKGSTPQDRTTAKNVIHKDIFFPASRVSLHV